jgi:hypothetical protein
MPYRSGISLLTNSLVTSCSRRSRIGRKLAAPAGRSATALTPPAALLAIRQHEASAIWKSQAHRTGRNSAFR